VSPPTQWLSATETAAKVASGELTASRIVDHYLARIANIDREIGAYLVVSSDEARRAAQEIDQARAANQPLGPLAGVPIALKDMLVTKGTVTTAGSKILEGWIPPYDGTVVEKLRAAGAIILGKVNCDEFGMGSSTERSAYKKTKNPWDTSRVPGGSSGGSAGRSRRACVPRASAPIPVARCASPRRSAAASGSSRPTGESRAGASSRSRARSIRSGRSRAPCAMRR